MADISKINVNDVDYNIKDVDAVSLVKVWENASPTSNFAAQTITNLNLSPYTHICIDFYSLSGANIVESFSWILQVGSSYNHVSIAGASSTVYFSLEHRYVSVSQTSVTVGDGEYATSTGYKTGINNIIIPRAIYGIKGVQA